MLRIVFRNRHRNLPKSEGLGSGPQGRINRMRKLVTALYRHERIEGPQHYLDESRGYAERLLQIAMKNGDAHKETMDIADYWLLEKDLIHKLFKVLVPRYKSYTTSFTQMHNLPIKLPGKDYIGTSVLELKGNPWPPVLPKQRDRSGNLVNVLLQSAATEFYQKKANTSFTASSAQWTDKQLAESAVDASQTQSNSAASDATGATAKPTKPSTNV